MTQPAVGIHAHPTKKLGLRPRDPARVAARFSTLIRKDAAGAPIIPSHPIVDAQPQLAYPMDRNDAAGDCVVAGSDHALQIIYTLLTGSYTNWTDAFLLAAYQTQNPGFTSWADAGTNVDGGMDVPTFLDWLVAQGMLLGWADVDYTNDDELRAAMYLGLAIVTTIDLQQAQQSGDVWDFVVGSADWGGHLVAEGGYGTPNDQLVSWGSGAYSMTQAFRAQRMNGAYLLLTRAHVQNPTFRGATDLAAFAAEWSQISGAPFPAYLPELDQGPAGAALPVAQAVAGLSPRQSWVAGQVIGQAQAMGLPAQAAVIAIETCIVESSVLVLANPNVPDSMGIPHDGVGSDHASVGPFQQQVPSWGTAADCMNPPTSAAKFLDRLKSVANYLGIPTGVAAQDVQISAFPDRYQLQQSWAEEIVNALSTEGEFTMDAEAKAAFAALSAKIDHNFGETIVGDKTHLNTITNVLHTAQASYNILRGIASKLGASTASVSLSSATTMSAKQVAAGLLSYFLHSFAGFFAVIWVASGVDVSKVTSISGAEKAGLALVGAAGVAALRALWVTVQKVLANYTDGKVQTALAVQQFAVQAPVQPPILVDPSAPPSVPPTAPVSA